MTSAHTADNNLAPIPVDQERLAVSTVVGHLVTVYGVTENHAAALVTSVTTEMTNRHSDALVFTRDALGPEGAALTEWANIRVRNAADRNFAACVRCDGETSTCSTCGGPGVLFN